MQSRHVLAPPLAHIEPEDSRGALASLDPAGGDFMMTAAIERCPVGSLTRPAPLRARSATSPLSWRKVGARLLCVQLHHFHASQRAPCGGIETWHACQPFDPPWRLANRSAHLGWNRSTDPGSALMTLPLRPVAARGQRQRWMSACSLSLTEYCHAGLRLIRRRARH